MRGAGRTTDQIKALPTGGVFVVYGLHYGYMSRLRHYLNRRDVRLFSLYDDKHNLAGMVVPGYAIDHFLLEGRLTPREEHMLDEIKEILAHLVRP